MSLPAPDDHESELQKQLDGMSRGNVNHEPLTRELILLKIEKLKKPHWSVIPSFALIVVAVFLALLALSQVQSLLLSRSQGQQSSAEPQNSASPPIQQELGKVQK